MTDRHEKIGVYLDKWGLALEGAPFETPSSLIAYVRAPQGPAVLKLFKAHADEARSPRILAHYGGCGAVRVFAHDQNAALLDRVMPGTPLSSLVREGRDDEATRVICDVAARLHACRLPPFGVPAVEDRGAGFARYRTVSPHPLLSEGLTHEAEAMFFEVCVTQGKRVLLHGDLHHDNILLDERRGWLAIDPKGVVGETAYELPAALRSPACAQDLFTDPAILMRRIQIMSERSGTDSRRLLRWHFAQAVLSAIWLIEDGFGDEALTPALAIIAQTRKLLG